MTLDYFRLSPYEVFLKEVVHKFDMYYDLY